MLKHYLCFLLMIAVSIVGFRHAAFSAYEWPTMDMLPFLEKYYNPDFVKGDFYTNSFSEPNPRYIWGYFLIGVTELLHLSPDWYQAVFIIKIAFMLLYPVALYYLLTKLYSLFESDYWKNAAFQLLSVFFVYSIVHYEYINHSFTIADWRPYNEVLMPQTLSLFLGVLAILFVDKKYPIFYIFLFLSTSFHLSVGVLFSLLACICVKEKNGKNIFAVLVTGIVLPGSLLTLFFGSDVHLSGKDFVEIYDFNIHPFHYIPSEFNSLIYPWTYVASMLSFLFLLGVGIGFLWSNKLIVRSSLISFLVYAGSILIQYLFVELIPVKLVAVLGPSRYTFLGYWMLVFVYGAIGATLLWKLGMKYQENMLRKSENLFLSIHQKYLSRFYLIPIGLSVVCFFISCVALTRKIDHPKEQYTSPIVNWIQKNTPEESVIMAPYSSDIVGILYISNRALFSGQGFPFNEKYMKEAGERSKATYGSYEQRKTVPGKTITEKYDAFYRSHPPQYFINLSKKYRIDYLIVETGYDQNFNKINPVYADQEFKVYSMANLSSLYGSK